MIKINDRVKYIFIAINNKLNFEEHINAFATHISEYLEFLCKLCHILSKSALRNLYYSMIHHYLLLCRITVWENALGKHFKRLANLQDKGLKLISGPQWRDQVTLSNLKQQSLKLNDLYLHDVAKLIHKY